MCVFVSYFLSIPSFLEPTSGLDASSAYSIVRTLETIAHNGRTVLCSIHQPRSDIFHLFDRLLLMGPGGRLLFYGQRSDIGPYFSHGLNMVCPKHTSPADWLLDQSALDFRTHESEQQSRRRNEVMGETLLKMQQRGLMLVGDEEGNGRPEEIESALARDSQAPPAHTLKPSSSSLASGTLLLVERAPFLIAFRVLLHRSWVNFRRQPLLIAARVGQVLAFAVILAIYYTRLVYNQDSVQNRLGLIQEFTAVLFIGMLNNIAVFVDERNIFFREFADRSYGTAPFFFSYLATEIVFEVFGCFLFAIICMFIIGMQSSAGLFFMLFYFLVCVVNGQI